MTFDLTTWKENLARRLQGWPQEMQRLGINSAYGYLAMMALLPVAEAMQGGQSLPAAIALGGVAGGVGGKLIAEQLQRWQDRANTPEGQVTLAAWVERAAAEQEVVRAALDDLMEKLALLPLAQQRLSAAERPWFAETLREELARLGNLPRYEATLTGIGIIAQGKDIKVVGERAISTENVGGDVLVDSVKVTVESGKVEPGARTLREAYLHHLMGSAASLPLEGIDPQAASEGADAQMSLDAVYTALLTLSAERHDREELGFSPEREPRRLSALAHLDRHEHLVLLGDPGSGKSTFVNFVALCLAGEWLGHAQGNLRLLTAPLPNDEGEEEEEPQPWQHGALLPVRVILRDFAARGLPPSGEPAGAADLMAFIEEGLQRAALGEFVPHLRKILREEGGLLLLDGLDEVPEAEQRRVQLKRVVEDVARSYPRCRLLLTSRTYAYQKQEWRLTGFAEAVLAPFSRGQVRRFVARWYRFVSERRGMDPEDAQGRALLLREAIERSTRLSELAERPLLLTLMASLHAWRRGSLPERREELYADAVELLLDWWEQQRLARDAQGRLVGSLPSLSEWLRVDRVKVRALLERLAYEAHLSQPDLVGTADIPEEKLVMGLMHLSGKEVVDMRLLIEYLSQRAGLLLPRGVGVYTFPHRTFQEYLAACYLTDYEYPERLAGLLCRDPNRWREVALLAGAKAAKGTQTALWLLVEELCIAPPDADDGAALWSALVAGQLLAETVVSTEINRRDQPKLTRVRAGLEQGMRSSTRPAIERAEAGRALALLGDPRPEATTLEGMEFCLVPAGPFWMGSPESDELGQSNERPLHELDIPYDYWLGRYPVTNAQYAAFVAAGGYREGRYWGEARVAGYWSEAGFKGFGDREARAGLAPIPAPYHLPNHPVVNVAWYEALAFTRWLTEQWRAAGFLPEGWGVVLPSEAEWEKGARGGLSVPLEPVIRAARVGLGASAGGVLSVNPLPQRRYPWGEAADPQRASYDETQIGTTSAVGCFRAGQSPYGCEEMSGSVWEWMRSLWGTGYQKPDYGYPYEPGDGREALSALHNVLRVLRGGSFAHFGWAGRCAFRYRFHPDDRSRSWGFRAALSPLPLPSGLSER